MQIQEFLKFEKKKIVLPVILLALLAFVLVWSAVNAESLNRDANQIVDSALNALKLVVYNSSLNGTDENIQNQLSAAQNTDRILREKEFYAFMVPGVSYAPEYVLNTFGANFCADALLIGKGGSCAATEMDLVLPSQIVRLALCLSQFLQSYNETQYPGSIFHSGDISQIKEFIYSDRGQNIFNEFEGCSVSKETLLNHEKMQTLFSSVKYEGSFSSFSTDDSEIPQIRLLTPLDIIWFAAVVFVTSYLLSCLVLWVHRRNHALYGKGRKVYLVIILLLAVIFFVLISMTGNYYYFYIRLVFFISLILSYIVATIIWKFRGSKKEKDIFKDISQDMSLRRS